MIFVMDLIFDGFGRNKFKFYLDLIRHFTVKRGEIA